MAFTTPVLLIIFRRPDIVKQLIDAVRVAAPTRIFISCDGPSLERAGEAEKVAANRELVEREIDWPCTIERRYSDINEGPRVSIAGAITWFFERVEEGIILEEDCIPHPDFFPYCAELLERYRHDTRVWHISGTHPLDNQWRGDGSYYFSKYPWVWGMATWRNRWKHYDVNLSAWPAFKSSGAIKKIFKDPFDREWWTMTLDKTYGGTINSWDFQWCFACMSRGGLCIVPNRNLINNIGFGVEGVYCFGENTNSQTFKILPLTHPSVVRRNVEADDHICYGRNISWLEKKLRPMRWLVHRVKSRLSSLFCRISTNGFFRIVKEIALKYIRILKK